MSIFLVSANTVDSYAGGYGINAPMLWGETAAWGSTFVGPFQSSINYRFGTTQVNNSPIYIRPLPIGSQYSLTELEKNSQNEYLYVNGHLVLSQGGKLPAINDSGSQLFLGLGTNNSFFFGDIAEILIYPEALSDSQRNQVEQYLMNKYGLH